MTCWNPTLALYSDAWRLLRRLVDLEIAEPGYRRQLVQEFSQILLLSSRTETPLITQSTTIKSVRIHGGRFIDN